MAESKIERKDNGDESVKDDLLLKIQKGSFIDSLTSNISNGNTLVVVFGGEAAIQSMIKEAQEKVPDVHILYGRDVKFTLSKLRDVRRFYFSLVDRNSSSTNSTGTDSTSYGNLEEVKKLGQVAVSGSAGPGRWLACLPYFLNGPYSLCSDRCASCAPSDRAACGVYETMIRTFDPIIRSTCFSTIFAPPFPPLNASTKPGLVKFYNQYGGCMGNFDDFIQICNNVLNTATTKTADRALEWQNQSSSSSPIRWLTLPKLSLSSSTTEIKYDARLDSKLRNAAEEFIFSLYPLSHPLHPTQSEDRLATERGDKKKKKPSLFSCLIKYDSHGIPVPME